MDDIQSSNMKELYPELYDLIYPNVEKIVDDADLSREITSETLDGMIDDVLTRSGIGYAPPEGAEAVPAQSGFGDRLRSLIRVLILKEILRRSGRPIPPMSRPPVIPAPPTRPPVNPPAVPPARPNPPAPQPPVNRPPKPNPPMAWPQMPSRPQPRAVQGGGRPKLPPKPPSNIY